MTGGDDSASGADGVDGTDDSLSAQLKAASEPAWSEAVDHRFTHELRAGTLEAEVFRRYLVQDYAFIESLVSAFGHAVGNAPTMAAKARLVEFLGVLTAEENDYFERAFDALGVPDSGRSDPELAPATRALEDLLGRAAREGGYAETLAVLVPAEWIYLEWATADRDGDNRGGDGGGDRPGPGSSAPERFYLSEWIDLHADPGFESFVGWLRTELDHEGERVSDRRRDRLARLFGRTVELERAFFESAYDTGRDGVSGGTSRGE